MPIRITAKTPHFRRAGLAHPATPTVYEDDAFTPAQLAALQAESHLVVEVLEGPTPAAPALAAEAPGPEASDAKGTGEGPVNRSAPSKPKKGGDRR